MENGAATRAESQENRTAFLYSLPNITTALAMTPLVTFIPAYYSGEFGMPLALVGAILSTARLLDIFTEPLVGVLSDNTRSRFGRRKLWIGTGVPFLMLGIWMVFAPPVKVDPVYAIFWIGLTFAAFNLVDTPYKAWGAELSRSYAGRTRIAAWRETFGVASSMLALALIFVLQRTGHGDTKEMLFWMAVLFVGAMPVLYGIAFRLVPEPAVEAQPGPKASLREGFLVILRNAPFLFLTAGFAVFLTGAAIGASLHLIVMEKVFGARDLFPIILIGENIAGLLAIPFWMWMARRIGKHRALALGALGMALLSAPIPLIPHDMGYLYGACIVIRGAFGGALGLLIGSMIADVVDHDKAQTGRERTALYYGLVATLSKVGLSFGILLGTVVPSVFGFETSIVENSDSAMFALLATYAWIPMAIMGCSAPLFWFYPLSETVQKDLRARIESRIQQAQDSEP